MNEILEQARIFLQTPDLHALIQRPNEFLNAIEQQVGQLRETFSKTLGKKTLQKYDAAVSEYRKAMKLGKTP